MSSSLSPVWSSVQSLLRRFFPLCSFFAGDRSNRSSRLHFSRKFVRRSCSPASFGFAALIFYSRDFLRLICCLEWCLAPGARGSFSGDVPHLVCPPGICSVFSTRVGGPPRFLLRFSLICHQAGACRSLFCEGNPAVGCFLAAHVIFRSRCLVTSILSPREQAHPVPVQTQLGSAREARWTR
jgi:hypothetical protein